MSHAPSKSRRERRIAARRAEILSAAADVFSQKGYERATVRDIAAAADVAEGTLYNYFNSKRALLSGVLRAYADEVVGSIDRIEADNVGDMMAALMTRRFQGGRERRLLILLLTELRLNGRDFQPLIRETMSRILRATETRVQALVAAGVMRPVEPAVVARTLSATIMGYAVLYELDGDGAGWTAEQLGAAITDIFLHGLHHHEKRP